MDQELSQFSYFTEIERLFQAKRDRFTLLSSTDWVAIEEWKTQEIPLECVLRGIERAFRIHGRVNSLQFCTHSIQREYQEWQRGSLLNG